MESSPAGVGETHGNCCPYFPVVEWQMTPSTSHHKLCCRRPSSASGRMGPSKNPDQLHPAIHPRVRKMEYASCLIEPLWATSMVRNVYLPIGAPAAVRLITARESAGFWSLKTCYSLNSSLQGRIVNDHLLFFNAYFQVILVHCNDQLINNSN